MENILSFSTVYKQPKLSLFSWPVLYLTLLFASLHQYIPYQQPNFWLGMVALMWCIASATDSPPTHRFAFATALFMLLYIALPSSTLLFFILLSGFLYAVEAIKGRLHSSVGVILFLMSPVANYLAEVFAFPIRLWLSQGVGWFFTKIDATVRVEGNQIWFGGIPFYVEDACMGLNMLISSLLAGHIGLWMLEKKYNRSMPGYWLPLVYVLFFVLNVAANYIRIICLVYFKLLPDTWMHDAIGFSSWLLYGLLPGFWLMRHILLQVGHYRPVGTRLQASGSYVPKGYHLIQASVLLAATLLLPLRNRSIYAADEAADYTPAYLQTFQHKALKHGVSSYTNPHQLIYVKKVKGFYSTDHNPTICWSGSGYTFKSINTRQKNHHTYFTALLQKDKQILYTAWWYECGGLRTHEQLLWRWHNLKNQAPVRLINISANTPEALHTAIENWIKNT